jgi:hypothetical protein
MRCIFTYEIILITIKHTTMKTLEQFKNENQDWLEMMIGE